MTKVITWIRNWWTAHKKQIGTNVKSAFNWTAKAFARLIVIGIILNIIASHFWPELPERIPTIYGFFDLWLRAGEILYQTVFKGLYDLFTGNSTEFMNEFNSAIKDFCIQFWNWMGGITF